MPMKKLRTLSMILKRTRASKILLGFVGFFFAVAALLWAVESGMTTYREAIWYCCAVIFTTGFGDFAPVTFPGRLCSIVLSCYALFALAIITGVVVAWYMDSIHHQAETARLRFLDKLEHLPELSREELQELSDQVKKLR